MDPGDCKLIQLFAHIIFTSVRALSLSKKFICKTRIKLFRFFHFFFCFFFSCSLPFLLCAHYLWTRSGYKIIEVAAAHFKVINSLEGSFFLFLQRRFPFRYVFVVGFIVFLGQLLLVMFAQHEHYEMPGMQWPKCVKHVHKVTIKPIWSHLLGEPFKTTNRTRARVEPAVAVPHIPYCTALNSNTNHFLMVRFIVLGARERRQTIKCNYTHINTQSEEFKKQLKQLNHNPPQPRSQR